MQRLVFLFLFGSNALSESAKPRSVNLALETVLEFDNKNDVRFIDSMQHFLGKLRHSIIRNRADDEDYEHKDDGSDDDKSLKFTDLISEIVSVLKSYDDKDLRKFFRTLDSEIKMWQTRNNFFEITEDFGFRRMIRDKLQQFREKPVHELRKDLNSIGRKLYFDKRNRKNGMLADFLNYFYMKESKSKLSNFLNNLKLYRSRNRRGYTMDLSSIIRSGMQTIIDPIIKLSTAISGQNVENKIVSSPDFKPTENNLLKDFLRHFIHDAKFVRDDDIKSDEDQKENEILDYIENQKRVIEKHITTEGYVQSKKQKLNTKRHQSGTNARYNQVTRTKRKGRFTQQPKHDSLEEVITMQHNTKKKKFTTAKTTDKQISSEDENEGKDLREVKTPMLINIANSEESKMSKSKSEEEVTSTKSQHTKQRRYKKFTRRQTTTSTKKPYSYMKTSKKSIKSLKTAAVSNEGMSIEHFGYLRNARMNRKSNDIDNFTNAFVSSTVPYEYRTTVTSKSGASTEIVEQDADRKMKYNIEGSTEDTKITESIEKTIKDIKLEDSLNNTEAETIKLAGNKKEEIEKTIKTTTSNKNNLEVTTLKPEINDVLLITKNVNSTNERKHFNFKNIKPTIIMRSHNLTEIELNSTITSTSTEPTSKFSTIRTATNAEASTVDTETDGIGMKTIRDSLENELESIIDKLNTNTTIPAEVDNFIKEVNSKDFEMDTVNGSKVKDQMRADLMNIFASSTTKSSVTGLFTDPFDGIDDGPL